MAVLILAAAAPAGAQCRSDERPVASDDCPPDGPAPGATAATAAGTAAVVVPPTSATDDYERIDALRQQGMTTNFPGSQESILRDRGGWRSRLADKGIYVRGQSINSLVVDIRGEGHSGSPQLYSGQKPTFTTANFASATFALDRLGLDDAQVTVGTEFVGTTWAPGGPTQLQLTVLEYYQSFLDKRLELKVGINANLTNFVGVFAGGNPILAAGLGGLIPVQVGLSASPANTPTINLTINGDKGLYAKTGVQRSISSRGLIYDARHNGFGIAVTQRDARPLLIQELGILRSAGTDQHQMWLRAGIMYNWTRYDRFEGGRARNHALYALGDYQLLRFDHEQPFRGLSIGASALYGPSNVNVYTASYEARAYVTGLQASRPLDTITFTLGLNRFSPEARRASRARGIASPSRQFQASLLYAARVGTGIFVVPSVAYLHNPSFGGDLPSAVNGTVAVSFLF